MNGTTPTERVASTAIASQPALEAIDVHKEFPVMGGLIRRRIGTVHAVSGVSLTVGAGETLGVVGESGCGKSTFGRVALNLLPRTAGTIRIGGTDIDDMPNVELRRSAQMVFQDPYASLNPRMTIGEVLAEPYLVHRKLKTAQSRDLVAELLERLQAERGIAYLFIAHDLSVVRHISHRVAVMYLGRVLEVGTSAELYEQPRHPFRPHPFHPHPFHPHTRFPIRRGRDSDLSE